MRLFAAFAIPQPIREQLLRLQSGVSGANWRPIENFHITLQFYGDVDEQKSIALADALQEIKVPKIDLRIRGLGSFGSKKPFALWAGVEGQAATDHENLVGLAKSCQKAGIKAGINIEYKNFLPHLTLAYCKNISALDAAQYFAANDGYPPLNFSVEGFQIYSSSLGRGPSRYQVLAEF